MESTVHSVTEMFGLTKQQMRILYSLEHALTENDIRENPKDVIYKEHWLNQWSACLQKTMAGELTFYSKDALIDTASRELKMGINQTWFYLVMLEATLFQAYVPLGVGKDSDKHYKKLRYKDQTQFLKEFVKATGGMDPNFIERFKKAYQKSFNKLSGKVQKVALGAVSVVAVAAAGAATAGVFAGPIAVSLFGGNFALHGAALTSASLAFAGGGTIAAGGAGMAGGVMAIAGGGALLGAASGGAAVSAVGAFAKTLPSFALTQAAKLEVVLKEIVLNAQKDVQSAQVIMEDLKQQIHTLQNELDELILEKEETKAARKNMEKTLDYLRKAYQDMVKFKSSYEIGMEYQNG